MLQACEYACQLGYISHQLNASLQDLYMKEEDRLDEEERNIKYLTEERLAELVSVYNTIEQPRRKEFWRCGCLPSMLAVCEWLM